MANFGQDKLDKILKDQQAQWGSFTSRAMESAMKLFELNMRVAQHSMQEASHSVNQLMSAKSPDQVLMLDQELVQERMKQALEYANEVRVIATELFGAINDLALHRMNELDTNNGHLTNQFVAPDQMNQFMSQWGDVKNGYEQWLNAGRKIFESYGKNIVTGQSPIVSAAAPAAARPKAPASRSRARK